MLRKTTQVPDIQTGVDLYVLEWGHIPPLKFGKFFRKYVGIYIFVPIVLLSLTPHKDKNYFTKFDLILGLKKKF